MNNNEYRRLKGFYENELTNQILSFWLPRCEDKEYGVYLNCFDNMGKQLVSYDKYTWSQGRFVWMFSRLANTSAKIFSDEQRKEFLRLAENGKNFLMKHCLMGEDDIRCVYLMDRDGSPKHVSGYEELDMSIYADCFAVLAMAGYAAAAKDKESYDFGKKLYLSIVDRVEKGKFHTLPYPLSSQYRAHGIPMILSNVTYEMYQAATLLEPGFCDELKTRLAGYTEDILTHFAAEDNVIHEVITSENKPVDGILGQHANPGHTIEDMWFMIDAMDLLEGPAWMEKISGIVKRTLEIGWDTEFGGILHYAAVIGGRPEGEKKVPEEPTEKQVEDGWGDKLWWVHAEALYTTLLCYMRTGDEAFWNWHEKVFEYTFETFPNKDQQIREWVQIHRRNGEAEDKVVALPVKDPFHITRDLILILELLEKNAE